MVGSRLARFFCEILASEGWGVEELEQVAFRILQFLVGDSDHAVLVMYLRRSRPKTERRNGLYITRPSLLRATCRLLLRRHTARYIFGACKIADTRVEEHAVLAMYLQLLAILVFEYVHMLILEIFESVAVSAL